MTTQTLTMNYREVIEQLPADSSLILQNISWEEYEEVLEIVGEASGLRITYDEGTLQIMTLSTEHESLSDLIQDLVRLLSIRLRIKILSFGSSTIKKQRADKGVEPDGCFYVQNATLIGNKTRLDFSSDPPPDIVVEIDVHHESLSKFDIYAELGVPEIWRYDGKMLTIYHLEGGQYGTTAQSTALPMLSSDTLTQFLKRGQQEDQYETLLAFEEWLQALK
jgi:Uma2 family endonuclease